MQSVTRGAHISRSGAYSGPGRKGAGSAGFPSPRRPATRIMRPELTYGWRPGYRELWAVGGVMTSRRPPSHPRLSSCPPVPVLSGPGLPRSRCLTRPERTGSQAVSRSSVLSASGQGSSTWSRMIVPSSTPRSSHVTYTVGAPGGAALNPHRDRGRHWALCSSISQGRQPPCPCSAWTAATTAPPCSVVCCHGRKCRMPGCVAPVLFPGHLPSGAMGARTPSRRIGRACGGGDVVTRWPRMRSVPVRPYRGAARRGEAAARRPGRSREAVRPRPGVGSRAECPAATAAAREPDPARRPFPRQGAGHRAGVPALRQPRASRAVGPQERVQITMAEDFGIEGRGRFYD